MKIIISLLILTLSAFAYVKGDQLNPNIIKTLKLQQDKLYIIDFFASWCGSCKKEMPLISKVNTQIDKAKVEIIGIDVDRKLEDGLAFQKKMKAKGAMNFHVINDPKSEIITDFQAKGMPALYYIKNGKVLDLIMGAVHDIDSKILADIKRFQ